MDYRPRTRPGFYYRSINRKRDIIRVEDVFNHTLDGERSSPASWWVGFVGTLTDYDKDGPSAGTQTATWEVQVCQFTNGDWRRWPKDKPLPAKWQAFFDRNPI